jgi:hypothetical protein
MVTPVPEPVQVIQNLRNMALTLSPDQIGIAQSPEYPHVWGVLMETGYPQVLVTLVSLADGTASLYFGHGGGVIGGGEHASVQQAVQAFIASAEEYHAELVPTSEFPLPDVGRVKFYLLTFSGVLTADADEDDLGDGGHDLSDLFYAGHNVIAQLRQISEGEDDGE